MNGFWGACSSVHQVGDLKDLVKGTQVPVEELQSLVAGNKALMKVRQMEIKLPFPVGCHPYLISSSHFSLLISLFAEHCYYILRVNAAFAIYNTFFRHTPVTTDST